MDVQAAAVMREMAAGSHPMPADTAAWLRGYRAQLAGLGRFQGPPPAIDVVVVDVGGRAMRLYRPDGAVPRPTMLFCHGGGFVAGTLDAYDVPLRWLSLRSGWQIAAVDYRLAPEHPYPAAIDDCRAAFDLLRRGDAGVDVTRLAVGGDSAGGLLAAVLARHARDTGTTLRLQVLLYPNTDLRRDAAHASRRAFDGTVIRLAELHRSLDLYLGAADRTTPAVSPLLAPDLDGLSPTLLVSNELDPLRDEAEAYGARLAAAGVAVDAERARGMIHGALQYAARVAAGDALITRVADALRTAG